MKSLRWGALAVLAAVGMVPLAAHTTAGHGYALFSFDAGDAQDSLLSLGAGGEGYLCRGLAAGAELAYLFPARCFRCGVGLLSLNPSYHFTSRRHSQKIVPFVTAGYTLGFREGTANLFNWGGGATFWFKESLGLRLEYREHRFRDERFYNTIRVALAFR